MNQSQAEAVAFALGGKAHHTGGGIWVNRIDLPGGGLIVISDDRLCRYDSEDDWHLGVARYGVSWNRE